VLYLNIALLLARLIDFVDPAIENNPRSMDVDTALILTWILQCSVFWAIKYDWIWLPKSFYHFCSNL